MRYPVAAPEPTALHGPRPRVVVVDDDQGVSTLLEDMLDFEGYQVWIATNGHEARALVEQVRPHLVILDLNLPDMHGLILCTEIRHQTDAPIIIVSCVTYQWEATLGLKIGADDFVAKPFDINDLGARIDAVLRRTAGRTSLRRFLEPHAYRIGNLTVERDSRRATLGGAELRLTPTQYRLLTTLASCPDQVFTREELAQRGWGYAAAGGSRTIDVAIYRLRAKLEAGPTGSPAIVTLRGVGYKLAVDPHDKTRPCNWNVSPEVTTRHVACIHPAATAGILPRIPGLRYC